MSETSTIGSQPRFSPLSMLGRAWWIVLLRGVMAILFGIITFLWPTSSLLAVAVVFGVYAIADGIFALFAAISGGGFLPRWWLALAGLISLGAGALALTRPGQTLTALVVLMGAWATVRGLFEVIGAFVVRKEIENEWALALAGVFSIIFGIALIAMPGIAAYLFLWLAGSWAIIFGILLVVLAFRLKKIPHA